MVEVVKYTPDKKEEWDKFVSEAKNGTFLFFRDYLEYHSDWFRDCSLMLYDKGVLCSVFPCNIKNTVAYSHQGLTFGGILIKNQTYTLSFLGYVNAYNKYLLSLGVYTLIYKSMPQIYKKNFGDEEQYALFRLKAELLASNLSSCIDFRSKVVLSRNRKRNYKKALKLGVKTQISDEWEAFWLVMTENMEKKFGITPVHTCEEMKYLKSKFPNHIELLTASIEDTILGGAVLYKYDNVLKIQYAHASSKGKEYAAIDNIYQYIINLYSKEYDYMDFGTSCINDGNEINDGLLKQKEGFGARGIVFGIYKISTNNTILK